MKIRVLLQYRNRSSVMVLVVPLFLSLLLVLSHKQIRTKKVIMCYIKNQDELAEAARATTAKAAEEMLAQHFGSVPRKPYAAVHVCVCVYMYNHVAVRFVYACVCIQYIQVYSIYVEVRV